MPKIVYTLAQSTYLGITLKAKPTKVYTVWVHGPFGFVASLVSVKSCMLVTPEPGSTASRSGPAPW